MNPPSILVLYHSNHGHTARVARSVADGAGAELLNAAQLSEADWVRLDVADAIIFGSPTYMGGVSAPFKAFMDSTSKRWLTQAWKNKVAAGFVNAGTLGGDNLNALYQLSVFAMQHSMLWVGTGIMPSGAGEDRINRLGAFAGLITQSENAPPELTPPPGDIETARMFGARVAEITQQFAKGKT